MLERRDVTKDTLGDLFRITVHPEQENLVAETVYTLAQAAYEPASIVFGLWDGDTAVGLVAMIDTDNHPDEPDPGDVPHSAYLWRLSIAAGHQGKGYGRAAIELAKAQARDWGYSKLASSVVDAPNSNMGFYEKLGFRQTGDVVNGEIVIVMDV